MTFTLPGEINWPRTRFWVQSKLSGNKRSSCYSNRSNNSSHSESIDRSSGREIVESKHFISVLWYSTFLITNWPKFIISGTNSEKRLSITSGKVQVSIFIQLNSRVYLMMLPRWHSLTILDRWLNGINYTGGTLSAKLFLGKVHLAQRSTHPRCIPYKPKGSTF